MIFYIFKSKINILYKNYFYIYKKYYNKNNDLNMLFYYKYNLNSNVK